MESCISCENTMPITESFLILRYRREPKGGRARLLVIGMFLEFMMMCRFALTFVFRARFRYKGIDISITSYDSQYKLRWAMFALEHTSVVYGQGLMGRRKKRVAKVDSRT
jgi:hypothetical protein